MGSQVADVEQMPEFARLVEFEMGFARDTGRDANKDQVKRYVRGFLKWCREKGEGLTLKAAVLYEYELHPELNTYGYRSSEVMPR
jgi:hypothetical protein